MIPFDDIRQVVCEAGKIIRGVTPSGSSIHEKSGIANFCTDYDIRVQRFLMEKLSRVIPKCSFFGEEDTEGNHNHSSSPYTFFIDPIDGTTNFLFGYHHSCISVGLACGKEMIAGFVYNPYMDEMYHAIRGEGAFLNGTPLKVKDTPISEGIVAFGCARYNESDVDILFEVTKQMFLSSLSVRNGGSAALDLCRVASGNNAAYYELKLQPYDYAAASVIIEEAGGKISSISGRPITLDRPCSIVGGTPTAWQTVRKMISDAGFSERK